MASDISSVLMATAPDSEIEVLKVTKEGLRKSRKWSTASFASSPTSRESSGPRYCQMTRSHNGAKSSEIVHRKADEKRLATYQCVGSVLGNNIGGVEVVAAQILLDRVAWNRASDPCC